MHSWPRSRRGYKSYSYWKLLEAFIVILENPPCSAHPTAWLSGEEGHSPPPPSSLPLLSTDSPGKLFPGFRWSPVVGP